MDLIQWIVFCSTKYLRNAITISCGSIGFDGAAPTLRKKEPFDFKKRWICSAHSSHQSKYVCLYCRSVYFQYLILRLFGGVVTTRSKVSYSTHYIIFNIFIIVM